MSTNRDATRIVRSWLEEGVTTLPDRVLDGVLDQLPSTPQRRPIWPARRFTDMSNLARLAIAAAALVVVAIVGWNLLPGGSGPGGPKPTPSPTSSPTIEPSPTPIATPAMTFPALYSTLPAGRPLAPGDWILTAVEPLQITISVPEGWSKGSLEWVVFPTEGSPAIAFTVVDNLYADTCNRAAGFLDPALGPSVDDLVAALVAVPGVDASEPTDITIDGYSGKQLVLSKPGDAATCAGGADAALYLMDGEAAPPPGPGDVHQLWVVDVDGTRLAISIWGQQTAEPRSAEAVAIVGSIKIQR